MHDLNQLDARQRASNPNIIARCHPTDQLQDIGATAARVGDDGVRAGFAGQEERGDRRDDGGGDLRDRAIVDDPRSAQHRADQTKRIGAMRDREPGFLAGGDATNLDPDTFHVETRSERSEVWRNAMSLTHVNLETLGPCHIWPTQRWGPRAVPNVNTETVCFVIVKAREFDVKVAPEELDDGSNPSDDDEQRILEDYADDPTYEELRSFLATQGDDELSELLALMWIGRGDYTTEDWSEALDQVKDVREHHTIDYLLGTPLLADYLEEGLAQFGLSCAEFDLGRL